MRPMRTARQRRTMRRRIRTITVLAVASGGTAAGLIATGQPHQVRTKPAAAVSELVLPGLERLPDPAPTTISTTTVPVTSTTVPVAVATTVYTPPRTVVSTTTTVARAAPTSGSPVRVATTLPVATTATTTLRPVVPVGSCGPYPFTPCIPPFGSPSRWSCVLLRESGGNPRAVEPSTHAGGLFQLLPSTAAGLGFPPNQQDQPIAEQIQAATKLYLQSGFQPWSPSDGC